MLLTDYQEALYLPFLLKVLPSATVIATGLAQQLARISLTAFQETLADHDATADRPDFFTENSILDQYEERLDANF